MTWSPHSSSYRLHIDRWLPYPLAAMAILVASIVVFVILFVWWEAWPAISERAWHRFVVADGWYPSEDAYGMLSMVVATALVSAGAVAVASPLGIGCAVFMTCVARAPAAGGLRMVLGLLAGTPSVVFGLWGLTVLVPIVAVLRPPGASMVSAMLVLAIMILPTVALSAAASLSALPASLRQGSTALGLGFRRHVVSVALPAAMPGIASGIFLALARALGETMAVLMVAGNVAGFPSSIFDPVRVLTANIALEMAYAVGTHRSALFASGLVLAVIALGLALGAAWASKGVRHG